MSDPKDYVQEAHNKGQEDGANNEYNNPHNNSLDALLGLSSWDPVRSEAYDQGYENGKSSRE